MKKLIKKRINKKHIVLNISSNNPIKITRIIKIIDSITKKKANIKKMPRQSSEMYKTHGDNELIKKIINKKKFTSIKIGLNSTVKWFLKNRSKIKFY